MAGEMVQLSSDGKVETVMTGSQRIYSRPDTKKMIEMAKACKTQGDLFRLGAFVYEATKRQDAAEPEYTAE